jgi:hypothetical protein
MARLVTDVAPRLQHLPIGVATSARSAEVPACQPISLRAANGTKTARRWHQIRPVGSIHIRPLPMWPRRQTLRTLLLITCPVNGPGGRRGLRMSGRGPATHRMLSCFSSVRLLFVFLSSDQDATSTLLNRRRLRYDCAPGHTCDLVQERYPPSLITRRYSATLKPVTSAVRLPAVFSGASLWRRRGLLKSAGKGRPRCFCSLSRSGPFSCAPHMLCQREPT